jgi:hypothetical protein
MAIAAIHALGTLAALVGTASYLFTGPRRILTLHALSWAAWGAYFLLLGAGSGVAVAVISGLVCVLGTVAKDHVVRAVSLCALAPIWTLGIAASGMPVLALATWSPLLAATIETLGVRLRDHPIAFRAACASANLCWLGYGLAVGAHVSTAFALANLLVISVTSWRIWRDRSRGMAA